jgi:hypothetical protein
MHNTVLISENVLNVFGNKYDARTKNSVTVSCYALSFKCLSLQQSNRFIHWNFLGQTAVSRCEGFPAFQKLTPSPSSGCGDGLVAPKLIYATKPPAQPADGDGVNSQNVGKPSHLDRTVCPRKFHW